MKGTKATRMGRSRRDAGLGEKVSAIAKRKSIPHLDPELKCKALHMTIQNKSMSAGDMGTLFLYIDGLNISQLISLKFLGDVYFEL